MLGFGGKLSRLGQEALQKGAKALSDAEEKAALKKLQEQFEVAVDEYYDTWDRYEAFGGELDQADQADLKGIKQAKRAAQERYNQANDDHSEITAATEQMRTAVGRLAGFCTRHGV